MKRNFRYITKFEEETRSAMQTRAIGTIDGILNASKLLLTASKKLLRYCDKENNPFVEKLTQFIQTLQAHIQMASRVEKLGLKELSLQYGVDSDNIVTLVGQFYFVDYRKQGIDQRKFEGLMDDVVAKGNEVDSLANLADRSSSARLETRGRAGELDEVGARELYLFADNESALQNQQKSIITNLARKFAKGAYDKDLAIKLWTYLADSASKLYSNDNGAQFTPATRRETARMLEELHFPSVQDEAIDYKKRSSSAQLETRGNRVTLEIEEKGNGFPSKGDLVTDGSTVWEITRIGTGHITTGNGSGKSNSITVTAIEVGEPSDYTDDEYENMHGASEV